MTRARPLFLSLASLLGVTWFLSCNPPITGAHCPQGQSQCPTGQVCTPQGTCELPPGAGGGAGGSGGTGGAGGSGGAGGGTGGAGGAGGGSAKKPDGQACLNASECQSNICTGFYNDDDGDGYGRPPMSGSQPRLCGTTPPQFYSTTNNDCCDGDNRVFPGQTQYFATPRNSMCMNGANPFDYDCNLQADPEPLADTRCVPSPTCNTCARGLGWAKPGNETPPCGGDAGDQVVAVDGGGGSDPCIYSWALVQPTLAKCR